MFACTAKAGEEAPFVVTVFADQPLGEEVAADDGGKALPVLPDEES